MWSRQILWAVSVTAAMAAQATPVDDLVAAVEKVEKQADTTDGPGWPDVSKAAEDRRTAELTDLRARLKALPPSPEDSEEALTRRLLDWRLGIVIEAARFDEARIPFDSGDGFFNVAGSPASSGAAEAQRTGAVR